MDRQEVDRRLGETVEQQMKFSYDHWSERIGVEPLLIEGRSDGGSKFTIEVAPMWDDKAGGDIRVMCSINYGGTSSFMPPVQDFIIRPDGTFVE